MTPKPNASLRTVSELDRLEAMKMDELRSAWRTLYQEEPPAFRAGDLMRRALANKLQEDDLGRDRDLEKSIEKLVRGYRRGERYSGPKSSFKAGVLLTREHCGVTHHVEVLADGFRWNGQDWKSLSQIARQITGVRWNGPRFFGLREPAERGGAR